MAAKRSEFVYRKIRDAISKGEYPPGSVLGEQSLANSLGVSRTPVREALQRLEADGWVTTIPGRGALVRSLSVQDLDELFTVREELEALALRLAIPYIPPSEFESMEKELESLKLDLEEGRNQPSEELVSELEKFHSLLVDYCGNRLLARQLRSFSGIVHRLRIRSLMVPSRSLAAVAEHLKIIEALRKKDSNAAEKLLREHIKHVRQNLEHELRREQMGISVSGSALPI